MAWTIDTVGMINGPIDTGLENGWSLPSTSLPGYLWPGPTEELQVGWETQATLIQSVLTSVSGSRKSLKEVSERGDTAKTNIDLGPKVKKHQ